MDEINWKAYATEQFYLNRQAEKALWSRIEALEARVAAADKLAEEMTRLMRRTPFVPAPNGIAVTITVDQIADQKAALAAYQATKEQSK